jgi:hypothetical protein
VPLDLHAACDVHLIGDHIAPLHDVQGQVAVRLGLFDEHAAVLGSDVSEAIEKDRKGGLLHPIAVLLGEEEGLDDLAGVVAEYLHVLSVDISRARRDVHAELGDVIERLLSAEAVLRSAREFAVVVQLDRAQRLVLAELVAGRDLNGSGAIVLPLLLYKFVDSAHNSVAATLLV